MARIVPNIIRGIPPKQGTGGGGTAAPPSQGGSGYVPIYSLHYPGLRPYQVGVGTPIPNNNMGLIGQRPFSKRAGAAPVAKIVIKTQLINQ